MRDAAPKTIYLKDYTPPAYLVDEVHLTFKLHPTKTRVISRIAFRPNPENPDGIFELHGEDLSLLWARIDGQDWKPMTRDGILTTGAPRAPFVWEAEVEINPSANTALEGLYMSNGMYSTQCEAEGFRKITYYPDRPDVLAPFTVRIESGQPARLSNGGEVPGDGPHPVLLSNGNPTGSGEGWAEWHDPWPKPSYLFALVAGDLVAHRDSFTTMSGKHVDLALYVRPGDEGKCAFGMQALKDSMIWDEKVYGREYDLEVFNIVAVDDFNMGAMENKGLNIFNSAVVLASPETSTDGNFETIEAIIAHEYFHNWTGNRITCRDWFQLCLKEGLTVFRDAQFTADMRSAPVKRIEDVIALRARQFPEDQGPLAHPVRPESFQEINNFYTATVYEKGAEVIGMLKSLVGDQGYEKALSLYFERHDGDAATIEDWLQVFEDATGRDLTQFKRWYSQAGTPTVSVREDYADGTYSLTLSQSLPPSTTTTDPQPMVIPVAVGLLSPAGEEIRTTQVLELTEAEQTFTFDDLSERPVPSILRGFSAPVILEHAADHAFLLSNDTDPFNRWEAARTLARDSLLATIRTGSAPASAYLDGIATVLGDARQDPAYRSLILAQPTQTELAAELHKSGDTPDPDAIYAAVENMRDALAKRLSNILPNIYADHQVAEPYAPNAEQSGKRSLANAALGLISRLDDGAQAQNQYDAAGNMTQKLAALSSLIRAGKGGEALTVFEAEWRHDRLVMDKWFGLQVALADPDKAVSIATKLTKHVDFNVKNPNRFRSVVGAFAGNHAGFHQKDGSGYAFLAEWLIRLDPLNPQTTARMCTAFQTWKRYDSDRQTLIKEQLERIAGVQGLSADVTEMITRIRQA
ncbi:MAG: aminopeptidase N [Paracoccaceae bacterium]